MLCLFLFGQSLHEFANSLSHLLHGDIMAVDGLIEQQTEAGDGENTNKKRTPAVGSPLVVVQNKQKEGSKSARASYS